MVPRKITVLRAPDPTDGVPPQRRRRLSDKLDTVSVSSQFSIISLATVHSIGSDMDDATQSTGAGSPAAAMLCSATSQCGGDFVVLPAEAASC